MNTIPKTYYELTCKNCGIKFKRREKRFQYCSLKCRIVPPGECFDGKTFGWLTVIKEVEGDRKPSGQPQRRFECQCKCGNIVIKTYDGVKGKSYKNPSCGCFMHWHATNRIKHGMSKTKIFKVWAALKRRCYKEKDPAYRNYGGKGIKVCDRWLHSFENFYEDMGEGYKEGLTLDRFPNQRGNYEPSNCRWATYTQQARNISTNVLVTVLGHTACVSEWAEILKCPKSRVNHRVHRGLSSEEAILGRNKEEIEINKLKIKEYYEGVSR